MRIQEHIYQGFFGVNKKQDAGKYYHERVEKLKGFDKDLDIIIEAFQNILSNHNTKLNAYQKFLDNMNSNTFQNVRLEIEKLEGMYDEDELANDKERKYVFKNRDILNSLAKNEESTELGQLEQESITDLNELLRLLQAIEPVWQAQIDFIKNNNNDVFKDAFKIKELSMILKKEGEILKMEEILLRKIDLKTGSILRKTTLKERGIEKTKDMDMSYRELKYIR
jgi:hypothetical protein